MNEMEARIWAYEQNAKNHGYFVSETIPDADALANWIITGKHPLLPVPKPKPVIVELGTKIVGDWMAI